MYERCKHQRNFPVRENCKLTGISLLERVALLKFEWVACSNLPECECHSFILIYGLVPDSGTDCRGNEQQAR